ncbi:MAG: hypothetical protein NTY77_02100 [Elusimicrobia bacterium]|nr:hypothetical protein [Elusimicrobiota bacterium]
MIQRDWFMNHIEIMVKALSAVLGLKNKGEIQAAAAALEAAIHKAFGISEKLALALPLEEVLPLACRGQAPSSEFLSTLASLFREWAGLLETQGRPAEAAAALSRAQALLQLAQSNNKQSEEQT